MFLISTINPPLPFSPSTPLLPLYKHMHTHTISTQTLDLRWFLTERWNKRQRECACQWVIENINHSKIKRWSKRTKYCLTCWVWLLSLHINKLVSLIFGSDPLFTQQPVEGEAHIHFRFLLIWAMSLSQKPKVFASSGQNFVTMCLFESTTIVPYWHLCPFLNRAFACVKATPLTLRKWSITLVQLIICMTYQMNILNCGCHVKN